MIVTVLASAGIAAATLYYLLLMDNVRGGNKAVHTFFIASGSNLQAVTGELAKKQVVRSSKTFSWVARRMNLQHTLEPGMYLIPGYLSNVALVRFLRLGNGESTISLPIHSMDSRAELAALVSSTLEADSASLHAVLLGDSLLSAHGLNRENGWAIVLADTYEFYWDTDAGDFFKRMLREFDRFWTEDRRAKAGELGLSPMDCIILASIIERESVKSDEFARIAGVYVNRLRGDWPLQADPTVKYALNQPGLRRILYEHLEIDSPYNTYKYKGLPPGPIGLPEKTTIDAVLGAENHDYMYFCARADFSGYHVFAKTLAEHNRNAREYQWALNNSGIY